MTRLLATALILALVLTSCVAPTPPAVQEAAATPTAAPEPTTLPSPTPAPAPAAAAPTFEAAPCPFPLPPGETEGETFLCGFVTVPSVRSDPESSPIRLAVAVLKAANPATAEPDPVILLSGGPGEKTVENGFNAALVLAPFRETRDVIIFDQRGVGLSEPALECPEFVAAYLDVQDEPDPETQLRTVSGALQACGDRLAAEGHNLSAYNTTENAADVDAIRQALGYDQLNLYGGSYGSVLAQAVMRDYPEIVRTAILGAVLPAEKSFFVHVPITATNAVLRLVEQCAADEACNAAYPDLKQTLFDTVERLNANPVPITVTSPLDGETYDILLTGDKVVGNLVTFLYLTEIIPVLPKAIVDVANGNYDLMTRLSALEVLLVNATSRGMLFSVLCAEDLIGVTPADYLDVLAQVPPELQGQEDPEDVIEYGFFGICENWPVDQADPSVKEPVVSDIPTVLLEGELDPVTPAEYAEQVAETLSNSFLYVFPGVGHTVLVSSRCAQDIALDFIDDPTQEPDASCIAEMTGVAFDLPRETSGEITLVPITSDAARLSAVAPQEWERAGEGTYLRRTDALDPTALIYDLLPMDPEEVVQLLQGQLQQDEMPESLGTRQAEFDWTLYQVEVQGIVVDFAVAPRGDGTTLLVVLQSQPAEQEAFYQSIFLPALDSVKPMQVSETAPPGDTTLAPFTDDTFGLEGVAPEGWAELGPGVRNRGQSATDLVRLLQQAAPGMTAEQLAARLLPQLGLSELPEPANTLETATLTWTLYQVPVEVPDLGEVTVDLALAETPAAAYIVLLQSLAAERDALFQEVFLPAVEALTPTQ